MYNEQDCEHCKHWRFDTRMNIDVCEYGYICQFESTEEDDTDVQGRD